MSILDMFRKSQKAEKPEPTDNANPIEEKLGNQSDEERLADQKARLEKLPKGEQDAWVPEGDVEKQRVVDEAERPSE